MYCTLHYVKYISTVNVLIRTYVLCDCSTYMPPGVVTLQVVPYK